MINIEHLTKSFGERIVFQDINLQFEAGKVYALIGNSGCGKTTLLNILAKLEPYDKGSISYRGQELKQIKSHHFFKNELGYLFQNFGLLENETVAANLELGLIGQKWTKQEKKQREEEVLEKVGLDYLALDQKIYELSGGEAQRVALAKVILKDPPLILADELTAALDPETSQEIMNLLLSLKKPDRLMIIATHNPAIWEKADDENAIYDYDTEIDETNKSEIADIKKHCVNRMIPLEDYEMKLYAEGRLVCLERKTHTREFNNYFPLDLKGWSPLVRKGQVRGGAEFPVKLYLPEGSNEFVIIRH